MTACFYCTLALLLFVPTFHGLCILALWIRDAVRGD
jgi:hypothetical protein